MKRFIYIIESEKEGVRVKSFRRACKSLNISFVRLRYKKDAKKIESFQFKRGDAVLLFDIFDNVKYIHPSCYIAKYLLTKHPHVTIINKEKFLHPLQNKYVQQFILQKHTTKYAIPTYLASNGEEYTQLVKQKKLRYPCIAKKIVGRSGHGMFLLTNEQDIKQISLMDEYLFQNFIPNTGDYRVHVLGGTVIGMMKRIPKNGEFRNNARQGATGEYVPTNSKEYKAVAAIAKQIIKHIPLDWAGLDIIFDEKKKVYKCLEINTYPFWGEFQKTTGIDMPMEFIKYLKKKY